jgi:hypothetical protein
LAEKALGTLLPAMMKRHGIDMWIVVNEEFNSDPVTPHITPPIPIVGRRDIFIFIDRGNSLERIAMVRYDEERLKNHYRMVMPARDKFGEELKKIVDERKPKRSRLISAAAAASRAASHTILTDSWSNLSGLRTKRNSSRPPICSSNFSIPAFRRSSSTTATPSPRPRSSPAGHSPTR